VAEIPSTEPSPGARRDVAAEVTDAAVRAMASRSGSAQARVPANSSAAKTSSAPVVPSQNNKLRR
jgi:hypothetical protein